MTGRSLLYEGGAGVLQVIAGIAVLIVQGRFLSGQPLLVGAGVMLATTGFLRLRGSWVLIRRCFDGPGQLN